MSTVECLHWFAFDIDSLNSMVFEENIKSKRTRGKNIKK